MELAMHVGLKGVSLNLINAIYCSKMSRKSLYIYVHRCGDYLSIYKIAVPQENQHYGLDPDQPKHAAQAYPDGHFSPPVHFLFQESLLYISITLRRNVSARISMR